MKRLCAFIIATIVVGVALHPMTHIVHNAEFEELPSLNTSGSQNNSENLNVNLTDWHLSEGDYIHYSNYGDDYFEILNNSGHSPELTSSSFQVNVLEDQPCNFGGSDALCHMISHTAMGNITWYEIDNHHGGHDDHDDHDDDHDEHGVHGGDEVGREESSEYTEMIIDMIEWNQTTQIYPDFSATRVDLTQKFSMWTFDFDTGDLLHESIDWTNETHLSSFTGMPEQITVGSQWIEEIESTVSVSSSHHGHSDTWQQWDNISYSVTEELEIELPPNQARPLEQNVSMSLLAIEMDDGENIVTQFANDFFKYKYFNFDLPHNQTNTQQNSTGEDGDGAHGSHGENDADPECGDSSILYNHFTEESYTKQDVIDGNAENWMLLDENDFPDYNHPAYYNVVVHQVLDCTYHSQVGDWVLANVVHHHSHVNYYAYTGLTVESWHISSFTLDKDGDGLKDSDDQCPGGQTDWTSNSTTDFDGDGCRDVDEDEDDDNDGILDTREDECLSDSLNPLSVPLDNDGTGECDALDDDDDDDSFLDVDEIECFSDPFDSQSVPDDFDQDTLCDRVDSDDDGDGFSDDVEVECESDNLDAESMPVDTDNDEICNILDSDDDNDGWTDITEMACLSDHLDNQSTPSDFDGDGVCNELDNDIDEDGVPNAEDLFPKDSNKSSNEEEVVDLSDDNGDNSTTSVARELAFTRAEMTFIFGAIGIVVLLVVILSLTRKKSSQHFEEETNQVVDKQEYERFVDANGNHWLRKSDGKLLWWNGSEWVEYSQ